eukprot:COSAG01_NODE_8146_length_2904_cov_10.815686_7_plen_86_part_00
MVGGVIPGFNSEGFSEFEPSVTEGRVDTAAKELREAMSVEYRESLDDNQFMCRTRKPEKHEKKSPLTFTHGDRTQHAGTQGPSER